MRHSIMKEARKGCYRRVVIVVKKKLGTSKRLKDINILAVQFYYCTLENDSDQEAVHEIADRICDAGKFRCPAKPGIFIFYLNIFIYMFAPKAEMSSSRGAYDLTLFTT